MLIISGKKVPNQLCFGSVKLYDPGAYKEQLYFFEKEINGCLVRISYKFFEEKTCKVKRFTFIIFSYIY